jgi:hypothetical protein
VNSLHKALMAGTSLCLANCNFAQPQACHNVTSPCCMLFISKALLILAKHNGFQHFRPPHLGIKEAHRRFLRLAEDHCVVPQSAASRNAESRLDLYVCLRGLQHGAHAELDAQHSCAVVRSSRSVSERCSRAPFGRSVARKITPQVLENSGRTQTNLEFARSARFFSGLLGYDR